MNDAELVRTVQRIKHNIDTLLNALETSDKDGRALLSRIKDSYNGWPAGGGFDKQVRPSTDAEGEPMPGYSDPTGELGSRPDKARDDRNELDRKLGIIASASESALDIATRYTAREANAVEQQATVGDDEGCISCRRIPGPRTRHWWNPTFRANLCRFCYELKRATNRLPTKEELEAHRDGHKIKRTA